MVDNFNSKHFKNIDVVQAGMFLFLSALFLFEILRMGDNPGIYQDAIMSDYASAWAIHQQKYSLSSFHFVENIMLIGVFYHGNLQMFWTLFISLLTGTTSVIQYRIGTACWAIAIISCMQYLFNKLGVNRTISFLMLLIMTLCPGFVSLVITNDYAFLPGTLFTLLHLVFFKKYADTNNEKYNYIAGLFIGLAVYSYIIYVLYGIIYAIFVFIINNKKSIQEKLKSVFVIIHGVFAGVFFYLIGFFSIYISTFIEDHIMQNIIFLLIVVFIAAYNVFSYYVSTRKQYMITNGLMIMGEGLIAIASFGSAMLVSTFSQTFFSRGGTSVWTSDLSLFDRILMILHGISTTFRNTTHESRVLGYYVSKASFLWRDLFFAVLVIWMVVYFAQKALKKNDSNSETSIIVLSAYEMCFAFLMLLLFPGGAHPGHFVTFYLFSFLLFGLIANKFYSIFPRESIKYKITRYAIITVMLINIVINYYNSGVLATEVNFTGGNGYFTSRMTDFANEAIERQGDGENVLYLFPEWGFSTGFIYLTRNHVPFRESGINEDYVQTLWEEGYSSMVLAFFREENKDDYIDYLDDCGVAVNERIWYSKDGRYGFTSLEIMRADSENESLEKK